MSQIIEQGRNPTAFENLQKDENTLNNRFGNFKKGGKTLRQNFRKPKERFYIKKKKSGIALEIKKNQTVHLKKCPHFYLYNINIAD